MILDEFPDDIGAMNDLGYLWADQNKNLELALEMVQQGGRAATRRIAPTAIAWGGYITDWAASRGDRRVGTGDQAGSRRGSGRRRPDGVILDHLADAYAAAGRKDDAASIGSWPKSRSKSKTKKKSWPPSARSWRRSNCPP